MTDSDFVPPRAELPRSRRVKLVATLVLAALALALAAFGLFRALGPSRHPAPRVAHTLRPRPVTRPRPSAFRVLAPGITMAELERAYDLDRFAKIVIVRLELTEVSLGLRALPEHRFAPLLDASDIDIAVNAGFFEPDFSPSGLMWLSGNELSPANARGGSGVLVVRSGRAELIAYDALDATSLAGADLALQCGPRLVEADGSLGIAREAAPRAARTVVCIREGGRTLDLVVAHRRDGPGGPGLYTLAQWMHDGLVPGDEGCEAALNLDGGPSTALSVRGSTSARRVPPGPVAWALTVRANATR